jgi:protein-tyrosine phosphatase
LTGRKYRILMVCTGNICRSPVMERLMRARLREHLDPWAAGRFEISSAGTWAMVGSAMAPEAVETLVGLGGDPDGFAGRDLKPDMIDRADLILTATREHRGLAVTEVPRAASRTVTVREFARLLGPVTPADITRRAPTTDPVERMRAIAAAAFANRGLVRVANPSDDDIADPYGRARSSFERAAAEIDAALTVPLTLLFTR